MAAVGRGWRRREAGKRLVAEGVEAAGRGHPAGEACQPAQLLTSSMAKCVSSGPYPRKALLYFSCSSTGGTHDHTDAQWLSACSGMAAPELLPSRRMNAAPQECGAPGKQGSRRCSPPP